MVNYRYDYNYNTAKKIDDNTGGEEGGDEVQDYQDYYILGTGFQL